MAFSATYVMKKVGCASYMTVPNFSNIFFPDKLELKSDISNEPKCLLFSTKAVVRSVLQKKYSLRFHKIHRCQSLFFSKLSGLGPQACNFIKIETLVKVLFREFSKIFKNTFL